MKLRKAIEKSGGIKELVVAVLIGAWMLYQFIASFSLPQSNFDSLGSNGYARIVSGVGIFCIVLYMVQKAMEITKQYRSLTEEDLQGKPDDAGKENVKFWSHPIAWMRLHHRISMLVMCILYVFLIDKIGFIISSALYLFASMMLFSQRENRKIPVIILLTLLFSAGIYAIFRYGFTIILP